MSGGTWIVHASIDEPGLTPEDLCRACAVSPEWIEARVREGLLVLHGGPDSPQAAWRFDATVLERVRLMRRYERDFDAVPELAALLADLHDEIRRLRLRLREGG